MFIFFLYKLCIFNQFYMFNQILVSNTYSMKTGNNEMKMKMLSFAHTQNKIKVLTIHVLSGYCPIIIMLCGATAA